jgi:hypothetical protein
MSVRRSLLWWSLPARLLLATGLSALVWLLIAGALAR